MLCNMLPSTFLILVITLISVHDSDCSSADPKAGTPVASPTAGPAGADTSVPGNMSGRFIQNLLGGGGGGKSVGGDDGASGGGGGGGGGGLGGLLAGLLGSLPIVGPLLTG